MSPTVSVIICCYTQDRLQDIREAVASLQRQSRSPQEIILAVDNSRDLHQCLQSAFGESIKVILNARVKGLSATRNVGIAAAQGDLVAFLDDDAVAEPDWLEKLLDHFEDHNVYAAGGRSVLAWADGRPGWFPRDLDWAVGGGFTWLPLQATEVRNPHGHNMCFRRQAFSAVGMFETALGRHGQGGQAGEEAEFCLRLTHHFPDARIVYEPAAIVRHKVPASRENWTYLLKRSYGEGLSKAYVEQAARGHGGACLSTETSYLHYLLFHSVPKRLVRPWRLVQLAQVAAILLSTVAVGAGYLVGRWRSTQTIGAHGECSSLPRPRR